MNLIFLSHIHEEKELAIIIKKAIEDEFSGFVEVFVSSDGTTITPGANFLKRIEEGLTTCAAAIFLISPNSVKRNWINFELGAVWIRNITSTGKEIPAIPVCHSNITPSGLPMPLTNLNGVQANNASHLEMVFTRIQNAVGVKANLRTDFDALAKLIYDFEQVYTVGESIKKMLSKLGIIKNDAEKLLQHAQLNQRYDRFEIDLGFRTTEVLDFLRDLQQNNLNKYITLKIKNAALQFADTGTQNGANAVLLVDPKIIIKFENEIKLL